MITDGTTRTYITSYAHNYLGGITSITYPNGKIVIYGRDGQGRETSVSSTISGQNIAYVHSAAYLGPQGGLTKVQYGIKYSYSNFYVETNLAYSSSLQLATLQTLGLNLSFHYIRERYPTPRIYQITDGQTDQHFQYDNWGRLTTYWEPGTPEKRIEWVYDRYGNMLSKTTHSQDCPYPGCVDTFTVDPATNRVTGWSHTPYQGQGPDTYTYDNNGNRLGDGKTWDAENRLSGWTGMGFLYDANSRRFRKTAGATTTYFIYSAMGFLLVEDNWTEAKTNNYIYFKGQMVATHDQNDYVRFYFKDHLGSTRSIVTASPTFPWGLSWETTSVFSYNPFGDYRSSTTLDLWPHACVSPARSATTTAWIISAQDTMIRPGHSAGSRPIPSQSIFTIRDL